MQKEEPGASVEKSRAAADEKPMTATEVLTVAEQTVVKIESLHEEEPGEGSHVEYTELALDCLDLKAQEELLSPPQSGDYSISVCNLSMITSVHKVSFHFIQVLSLHLVTLLLFCVVKYWSTCVSVCICGHRCSSRFWGGRNRPGWGVTSVLLSYGDSLLWRRPGHIWSELHGHGEHGWNGNNHLN